MVNISVMATAAVIVGAVVIMGAEVIVGAVVIMGAEVIMGATTERAGTPQPASHPGPPAAMFRVAIAPLDPKKPVFDFRTPLLSLCAHGSARFGLHTPGQRPGEPKVISYQSE